MTTKNEPVIIPSTVYNSKIFAIFQEIASESNENMVAQVEDTFGRTHYSLVCLSEENDRDNLSPFTNSAPKRKWAVSYNTQFNKSYNEKRDIPFYQVKKKQFFANENELDQHFTQIKKNVEEVINRNIENRKEA